VLSWVGPDAFRVRPSRVGCRPYSKKTTKSGLDSVRGFNVVSVGLSSSSGTCLRSASSAAVVASSTPEALDCSLVEFLSSPPKVSYPAAVVEKFSAAILKQAAVGYSSVAVPALYQSPVDVGLSMGCSSGVGLALNPVGMGWGVFLPPFQWDLFPSRLFSSMYGSPIFTWYVLEGTTIFLGLRGG
jgi:hypothetical protein